MDQQLSAGIRSRILNYIAQLMSRNDESIERLITQDKIESKTSPSISRPNYQQEAAQFDKRGAAEHRYRGQH